MAVVAVLLFRKPPFSGVLVVAAEKFIGTVAAQRDCYVLYGFHGSAQEYIERAGVGEGFIDVIQRRLQNGSKGRRL